jgi:hypothetical protein
LPDVDRRTAAVEASSVDQAMRQFDSSEEATAWLATLTAAIQLASMSRNDGEGVFQAAMRFADKLTAEWSARRGAVERNEET